MAHPYQDTKLCSVEGCARKSRARKLCGKHYERWRKTGTTNDPKPKFDPAKTCSVDSCTRQPVAKGLCEKHYRRLKRTGSVKISKNKINVCSVNNCDHPASKYSFCVYHYQIFYRLGKPAKLPERLINNDLNTSKQNIKQCCVDGCLKPVSEKDLCGMHAMRLRNTGKLEKAKHTKTKCSIDKCDREAQAKGLCQKHYQRVSRASSVEIVKTTRCKQPDFDKKKRAKDLKDFHRKLNIDLLPLETKLRKEANYKEPDLTLKQIKTIYNSVSNTSALAEEYNVSALTIHTIRMGHKFNDPRLMKVFTEEHDIACLDKSIIMMVLFSQSDNKTLAETFYIPEDWVRQIKLIKL